ncbi:hypothetical protein CIK05_13630 [Bdellovibrio sp. qaytius]|nr:hypothetical protein CIK05_13630 [Bdellovibrio sp. qaytius]
MLKGKKLFIYIGVLAAMLSIAGCDSTIQDPVTPASVSPPMNGQSPVVAIESIRSGDYIKGGVQYKLHLLITDPTLDTNSSTIEYSRDAGLTWTVATSSTGQDGNDFATNSGEDSVFNWSVPRELDCTASSASSDGSNYKIRVTTRGRPDAFPTLEVTQGMFTVDSCAPVISGASFTYVSAAATGFSTLSLPDITDTFSLSPIKDVCLKYITAPVPSETDSCWLNVNSLIGTSGQAVLSGESMNLFFGFNALTSMTATLWARDYAHNQTELTLTGSAPMQVATGVSFTDLTDTFSRSCGGSYCVSATVTGGAVSSNVVVNSVTVINKTDSPVSPYDSDASLLDPQMFVVNSAGIIYLRDKVNGIIKIDPIAKTRTQLVQIGTFADGLLASARVVKPMRLALDREENLIIFDNNRIRRINLNEAPVNQTIETIVGGGTDTSGTVKVATNLQIDYHDNLLWYGTFQVLPNNWIVFNSENPHKKLVDATDRFRLRVYRPDREIKIVSINLSGTGVDIDPSQAVDNLWPYGGMAVSYDSANKDISYIYARLCDAEATCSSHSLGVFDADGVATSSSVIMPSTYSNNYMFVSRAGKLYSMNRFEGKVKYHDGTNWLTALGRGNQNFASLCAEATTKQNCEIDLWDAFVGANERIYFIDSGQVRFVDLLNGRVYTYANIKP